MQYHMGKLSYSSSLEQYRNVNSIPGTTGPGIPATIRSILTDKYGGVDVHANTTYGAAAGM